MYVDEPSKPWSAGGPSTSPRDPFTIFYQPFPYSEWADRWEKEHLASSDFPVILNVNQWHPVDVCLLCWLPVSLPGLQTCRYPLWDLPASWGSFNPIYLEVGESFLIFFPSLPASMESQSVGHD